jgi:O-antigen ligase
MNLPANERLPGALLFFFALFVFSSTFSIALSQTSFSLSLLLFLVIVARREGVAIDHRLRWFYLSMILYVTWMLLAAVAGGNFLHSLNSMREEWLFAIIPVGIFLIHKDNKNADRLVLTLAIAQILVAVYAFGLYVTKVYISPDFTGPLTSDQVVRIRGNFSHPLTFGNYAGTAALFMFGYALMAHKRMAVWIRRLILSGGVAAMLCALISNSRGPIVSVLIGLVIMLFFLRRRKLLIGIALLLGLGVASLLTETVRARFTAGERTGIERHIGMYWQGSRRFIWTNALKIVKENPVIGVGPGNFKEAYHKVVEGELHPMHRYGHAHNDLLNVSAQAGITGGAIFALMWLSALLYFWTGYRRAGPGTEERCRSAAALLGSILFLGTSMTEATFVDEEVRALLMLIWAVGLSVWYNQGEKKSLIDRA